MDAVDNVTIAWAAGLFEGEGTFGISNGEAKNVTIHMTDYDVLKRMQDAFGGGIYPTKKQADHHKDAWKWMLYGETAANFITSIIPHLCSRRKLRAEQWLENYNLRKQARADKSDSISARNKFIVESYASGNMTHAAIANSLGVDRTTVSHVLRGRYE